MTGQVLFLHGAAGDARIWTPVIDHLPAGIDARAITLTYFGTAPWPDDGSGFGTERHRDDIVGYIEAAMMPPVHLVAWSYSCHPALLAALERPDLFASVFLYEPALSTYIDDPADRDAFIADLKKAFGPVGRAIEERGPLAGVRLMMAQPGDLDAIDRMPAERRVIYEENAAMMPLMLLGKGQPPAPITGALLSGLQVPVTVGMGEQTRPVFAIPCRTVARACGQGRLVEVPGAEHMLPETDPAAFAALVSGWLAAGE